MQESDVNHNGNQWWSSIDTDTNCCWMWLILIETKTQLRLFFDWTSIILCNPVLNIYIYNYVLFYLFIIAITATVTFIYIYVDVFTDMQQWWVLPDEK